MATNPSRPDSQTSKPTHFVVSVVVTMYVVMVGIAFLVHQSDLTLGWIYVGLFITANGICTMSLYLWNNELAWRRSFGNPTGTKTWDWVWLTVFLASLIAIFIVAVRDFDTPAGYLGPPGIGWLIGLVIYAAGWTLFTLAGVSNPFFEKTVRIQTEQGHRVVDKGLYSIIRHPGYIGFIAMFLATPLLLPSSWIYLLSLIAALLFVIRAYLEDRTLHAELPGYPEYATRVRFRLIPGVW